MVYILTVWTLYIFFLALDDQPDVLIDDFLEPSVSTLASTVEIDTFQEVIENLQKNLANRDWKSVGIAVKLRIRNKKSAIRISNLLFFFLFDFRLVLFDQIFNSWNLCCNRK